MSITILRVNRIYYLTNANVFSFGTLPSNSNISTDKWISRITGPHRQKYNFAQVFQTKIQISCAFQQSNRNLQWVHSEQSKLCMLVWVFTERTSRVVAQLFFIITSYNNTYITRQSCRLYLTVPSLQTNTDTFANSVDPDEMARNKWSHQDLHGPPFCSWFLTETPICNNGCVQTQRWKSPLQKLWGEWVKI